MIIPYSYYLENGYIFNKMFLIEPQTEGDAIDHCAEESLDINKDP